MKKISSIKKTFQFFLYLIFGFKSETAVNPKICFDGFINKERQLLKQAVSNFELKKRGV
jgi:hypothetical protein